MNSIQKSITIQEPKFEKFLEKIEFIYYDTEISEDKEENNHMDILLNDMIGEDNEAFEICRGAIEEGYIRDTFCESDIKGYIAKVDEEYAGFILFKRIKGYYYLSLVGTKPKLEMPLGQILIAMMEQTAIQNNIGIVKADSVAGALNFYKKHDWVVIDVDEEEDTYFIQKQVIKGYVEVFEDPDDDEEYFEEYANRDLEVLDVYEKSFVDRFYDFFYYYF